MRLTCLNCGHQVELATGHGGPMRINCACGLEHTYPDVRDMGTAPSADAAERSRYKAFRAAGLVKNVGGFALGISLLGVLFFPMGIIGAAVGIYCLTMVRGPVRRYSGNRAAIAAVLIGVAAFVVEGSLAWSWWSERRFHERLSVQQGVLDDLRDLRRAQRLYRAQNDTYGGFENFRFRPTHGRYTIYLSRLDHFPGTKDGQEEVVPLPEGMMPEVSPEAFTAVAVANLDDDPVLDVWVLASQGAPRHLVNDLADDSEENAPPDAETEPPESGEPVEGDADAGVQEVDDPQPEPEAEPEPQESEAVETTPAPKPAPEPAPRAPPSKPPEASAAPKPVEEAPPKVPEPVKVPEPIQEESAPEIPAPLPEE